MLDWELLPPETTRLEAEVLDTDGRRLGEGPFDVLVFQGKDNLDLYRTVSGKGPMVFSRFGESVQSYRGTPEVAIVARGRGVSAPQRIERTQEPWARIQAHLVPFARIEGMVVSGEGEGDPVPGATVVADCKPFDATRRFKTLRRRTATDLEGRFELIDLLPGKHTIWAHASGTAGTLSDTVTLGSGEKRDLTLRLTPGGAVGGRVVDTSGFAVEGAAVWFVFGLYEDDHEDLSRRHCFTDAEGSFYFDGLPLGVEIQGHLCGVTRDGQSIRDHLFYVVASEGETADVVVRIP
jgi:hypothetical protein